MVFFFVLENQTFLDKLFLISFLSFFFLIWLWLFGEFDWNLYQIRLGSTKRVPTMSCGRCKGTLSTSIIIDDVIEIFYVLNVLEHLYSLFIYCTAHLDNMCHGDSLSNKSTCNTGKITILKDLGFSCFTRQLLFFRFFWKRSLVHQHKCIKKN